MSINSTSFLFPALLKNEFIKFYKSKRVFGIIVITMLCVTLFAFSIDINSEDDKSDTLIIQENINQLQEYLTGDLIMDEATRTNYLHQLEVYQYMEEHNIGLFQERSLESLMVKINQLYAVFIMVAMFGAAKIVSEEYSYHTLQAIVSKPIPRWKVLAAKVFTLFTFCIGFQIVIFCFSLLSALIFWGKPDLTKVLVSYQDGIVCRWLIGEILYLAKYHFLSLFACSSMVVLLVVIFRNGVIGTSVGVVLYYLTSVVTLSMTNVEWIRHIFFVNVQFQLPLDGLQLFEKNTLCYSVCNVLSHTIIFIAVTFLLLVRRNADE